MADEYDDAHRWAERPSGLVVPEDLVRYQPPPQTLKWICWESSITRLPGWMLRDCRGEVVVRNS